MTSLLLQQLCCLQRRGIAVTTASGTTSSPLWGQRKPALCLPWRLSATPSGPEGCSSLHFEFTSSVKNLTNTHLLAAPCYWQVSLELTGLEDFPKTASAGPWRTWAAVFRAKQRKKCHPSDCPTAGMRARLVPQHPELMWASLLVNQKTKWKPLWPSP